MKQRNRLGRRALSLLLCLVMVVCMLPTAAFAAEPEDAVTPDPDTSSSDPIEADPNVEDDVNDPDAEDEVDDTKEPETVPDPEPVPSVIPASEAPVPSGALSTSTPTVDGIKTDTTWEYQDDGKKTDENKKLEEAGTADYGDSKPADIENDNRDAVDKLLNGTGLDEIEDGTYTKHDEQTKQEVTDVTVKGEQHETIGSMVDSEGRPVYDSYNVEGQQTTTTTTETTTKTTTTEVSKETDVQHSNEEFKPSDSSTETPKEKVENSTQTAPSTVTKGSKDLEDESSTAPIQGDEVTIETERTDSGVKVTMNSGNQDKENNWTNSGSGTQKVTLPGSAALLAGLNGWTVETKDNDGNAITGVVENGKVIVGGNQYEVGLIPGADGTYTFGIKATLDETTSTVRNPDESGNVKVGDKSNQVTEEGTAELKDENKGEYTLVKDSETGELVYVKTDVLTREDSNRWTEVTSITEKDFQRIVQKFERQIEITVADPIKVEATTTISAGDNNGKLNLTIANPQTGAPMEIENLSGKYTYVGYESADSGLAVGWTWTDGQEWRGNTHIYKLENENHEIIYGYCVEKGVNLGTGRPTYEFVNITDAVNSGNTNYSDTVRDKPTTSGYYITDEDRLHLNYIAQNGYWGNNLDDVKKLVREEYKNYITPEIAQSITQAAIWAYSDAANRNWGYEDNHYQVTGANVPAVTYMDLNGTNHTVSNVFPWTNGWGNVPAANAKAYMALYHALIAGTAESTQTDLDDPNYRIDTTDITQTTITVKEKVESQEELDAAVAKYSVDASMTMAIMPSNFGEGVMLYVYVDGKPVAASRLTGEKVTTDQNGNAYNHVHSISGKDNQDGSWTYSVSGLEVAPGVEINFKIEGTQELGEGLYLLQNDVYQNFATVIKEGSTRTVDINVAMNFTVTEGTTQVEDTQSGNTQTAEWTETTVTTQDFTSTTTHKDEVTTTVTVTTKVTSKEETTQVEEKVVESLIWNDSASRYYTYTPENNEPEPTPSNTPNDDVDIPDPETPLGDTPQTPEEIQVPDTQIPLDEIELPDEEIPLDEIELPDEEIPLADVPQTGDESARWCVMAAMAAAGLMGLTVLERKKRQDGSED